jgi:hypothetical protein
MASGVSALWSFVANGHQVVRHVSWFLSKIPYGGFSPVRLQIGRRRQPSPSRAYMPPKLLRSWLTVARKGQSPHSVGVEARSVQTHQSRGPWLTCGLYCPAGSSLTMASSEPLRRARQLIVLRLTSTLRRRGSQLLSACSCFRAIGLTPADRVVIGCSNATRDSLRRSMNVSASAITRQLSSRRPVNEAAPFALCYGPETRSPFTDKDFYIRAFIP